MSLSGGVVAASLPFSTTGTRRVAGVLNHLLRFVTVVSGAVITPHKSSVKNLAGIPLAVAGTGFIDFSAFYVNHAVGFLVLGLSLWLLDHLADGD
jgi:hypothetical protein